MENEKEKQNNNNQENKEQHNVYQGKIIFIDDRHIKRRRRIIRRGKNRKVDKTKKKRKECASFYVYKKLKRDSKGRFLKRTPQQRAIDEEEKRKKEKIKAQLKEIKRKAKEKKQREEEEKKRKAEQEKLAKKQAKEQAKQQAKEKENSQFDKFDKFGGNQQDNQDHQDDNYNKDSKKNINVIFRPGYRQFIEKYLKIVNKKRELVDFKLNKIQNKFLKDADSNRIVVLKARQQGFSSLILALFTVDFLFKSFTRNIIVADDKDNSEELLDRVKLYLESFTSVTKVQVPLKYNSKTELENSLTGGKYTIGTARKVQFGRSKTITNLHFSEASFFPDMQKLLAGALQAVTPNGRVIIETTANGFNYFKEFWDDAETGKNNFKPLFYKASDFYDKRFLEIKKMELGRMFQQEYPENPMEAFISSGLTYFEEHPLKYFLDNVINPKYHLYGSQINS